MRFGRPSSVLVKRVCWIYCLGESLKETQDLRRMQILHSFILIIWICTNILNRPWLSLSWANLSFDVSCMICLSFLLIGTQRLIVTSWYNDVTYESVRMLFDKKPCTPPHLPSGNQCEMFVFPLCPMANHCLKVSSCCHKCNSSRGEKFRLTSLYQAHDR